MMIGDFITDGERFGTLVRFIGQESVEVCWMDKSIEVVPRYLIKVVRYE